MYLKFIREHLKIGLSFAVHPSAIQAMAFKISGGENICNQKKRPVNRPSYPKTTGLTHYRQKEKLLYIRN
jgi:hypothetical protein